MFSSCFSSREQNNADKSDQQGSMKSFFTKGPKKTKQKRKSGNKAGANARNVNTLTAVERAEIELKKRPPLPEFKQSLQNAVFVKSFDEAEKDVLRLIRKVTVENRSKGNLTNKVFFGDVDKLIPEEVKQESDTNLESCYLLRLLLELLVDHFEEASIAEEMKRKMVDVFEEGSQTVLTLMDCVGGETSRSALVIKCLAQSIAITGHTHIKFRVCTIPTKDMTRTGPEQRGHERAWLATITLAECVQVRHTRREISTKGDWQLEFGVSMTFDRQMSEMTASQLAIIDLELDADMEQDMKDYLNHKFGRGNLVIC